MNMFQLLETVDFTALFRHTMRKRGLTYMGIKLKQLFHKLKRK